MFRSKLKLILFSFLSLFVFLIITFCCLFLYNVPEHPVSIAVFKFSYALTPAKKSFLEWYSPARRDVHNWYVPTEVNQFLIEKLKSTGDENEISGIVHFYSVQAQSHRIGYFNKFSEEVKPKIIVQLLKELDEGNHISGKLMLLEEIRTNKQLGKGSVGFTKESGIIAKDYNSFEEYEKWFDGKAAPIVVPKYHDWWNSNLSWKEKKKINPLEGTGIEVSHCCG